jgi:hypothetical protein
MSVKPVWDPRAKDPPVGSKRAMEPFRWRWATVDSAQIGRIVLFFFCSFPFLISSFQS